MQKNIFIILISTLLILVLIYLYDEKEKILNKEYYDNNISINYPYFNNEVIDNYLNNYLKSYLLQDSNLLDLLFIDYDYQERLERIELIFYIYQEKTNIVHKETRKITIDTINSKVLSNEKLINDNIENTSIEYNPYTGGIINKDTPMVALTFDDGPNHNTNRILDILEKYNAKATFFILGSNIQNNEKTIKRMHDLGMEIGNHLYSHKLLTKLGNKQIKKELTKVDNLIFNVIGEYPTLIRPSYGSFNKRIKRLMDRPIIIWNVDTLDWKYHNSKKITNRVLKNIKDGNIILMHDIYRATANSLESIIPTLIDEGYQLVTVSELLYYKDIKVSVGQVYSSANK